MFYINAVNTTFLGTFTLPEHDKQFNKNVTKIKDDIKEKLEVGSHRFFLNALLFSSEHYPPFCLEGFFQYDNQ